MARTTGDHMRTNPSVRSRLLEWMLWRIRIKKMFQNTDGLRGRVLKARPKDPKPPRSMYRRFRVEQTMQDGQSIFTISRQKSAAGKSLLYIHGGAYVYEIMGTQWKMIGKLLNLVDLRVTVPLYPLAPEDTVEKALGFVSAVYEKLLQRANGKPVVFLGESSGGGMAMALAQQLRDANRSQPASLVLLSPWLDVTCSDPSQDELEKLDPILARAGLREEGLWYAGALSPKDPCVSPLFGNLEALPPILVLTGTHDLLHADATRLQTRLADRPKALKVLTYPNMLHVWPSMFIPEAKEALREVGAFLDASFS